jgi:hypothetical protein
MSLLCLLHTIIAECTKSVELPHSAIYLDYCEFIQSCQHSMLSKSEGSELGLDIHVIDQTRPNHSIYNKQVLDYASRS